MRGMPEAERRAEIEEIRQHLSSLIAAQEKMGYSTEQATLSALQQFGDAQEIGATLNTSVFQEHLRALPVFVVNVLYVLAFSAIATGITRFALTPFLRIVFPIHTGPARIWPSSLFSNGDYSLILGMAATGLVLLRDGLGAAYRNLSAPYSVVGFVARWTVLASVMNSVISAVLFANFTVQTAANLNTVGQISIPLIAGSVMGYLYPRFAVQGATMVVVTGSLRAVVNVLALIIFFNFLRQEYAVTFLLSEVFWSVVIVASAYSGVQVGRKMARQA